MCSGSAVYSRASVLHLSRERSREGGEDFSQNDGSFPCRKDHITEPWVRACKMTIKGAEMSWWGTVMGHAKGPEVYHSPEGMAQVVMDVRCGIT